MVDVFLDSISSPGGVSTSDANRDFAQRFTVGVASQLTAVKQQIGAIGKGIRSFQRGRRGEDAEEAEEEEEKPRPRKAARKKSTES